MGLSVRCSWQHPSWNKGKKRGHSAGCHIQSFPECGCPYWEQIVVASVNQPFPAVPAFPEPGSTWGLFTGDPSILDISLYILRPAGVLEYLCSTYLGVLLQRVAQVRINNYSTVPSLDTWGSLSIFETSVCLSHWVALRPQTWLLWRISTCLFQFLLGFSVDSGWTKCVCLISDCPPKAYISFTHSLNSSSFKKML